MVLPTLVEVHHALTVLTKVLVTQKESKDVAGPCLLALASLCLRLSEMLLLTSATGMFPNMPVGLLLVSGAGAGAGRGTELGCPEP